MRPYRDLKIGSLIQEELSKIIAKEVEFDNALVTIVRVEISPDLLQARISLGIIPTEKEIPVFEQLEKRRRELEYRLLKKMNIRPMPHLKFIIEQH